MRAIGEKCSMILAICHDRSIVTGCAALCARYKNRGRSIRIVSGDRDPDHRQAIERIRRTSMEVISADPRIGNRDRRRDEQRNLPVE